jgi:chromosome segregation ATPase
LVTPIEPNGFQYGGRRAAVDGLVNVMASNQGMHASEDEANDTIERVALSGAEAIRSIIADRKDLRTQLDAQQREIAALNAVNEELHRRIVLLRHHFVELGNKAVDLIEQLDQATREAMRDDTSIGSAVPDADPSIAALAQKFAAPNPTIKK